MGPQGGHESELLLRGNLLLLVKLAARAEALLRASSLVILKIIRGVRGRRAVARRAVDPFPHAELQDPSRPVMARHFPAPPHPSDNLLDDDDRRSQKR